MNVLMIFPSRTSNRAYILRNTPRAWEHLSRLLTIPGPEITARIHRACRSEASNA
jgi:hypothetical protein